MNKFMLASTLLAVCAPVLAQSYITTPKGGLTAEGSHLGYVFGWHADARYQQADAHHVGQTAYTISEIGFRIDNRSHTTFTAMGRTWTSLSLDISETSNFTNMDRVWTKNITGSPTRAFDNKWAWPSYVGTPLLKPDKWGGAGGQLRFPFVKPWVYTGKDAILADYRFRGGALTNGGTWGSFRVAYYYLDSEIISTFQRSGSVTRMPQLPSACADSAMTSTFMRSFMYAFAYTHGAMGNIVTLRNKLQLTHYSYYTAPNGAPVVHAIGLGGNNNGVDINAKCNKLYVDLSKPTVLVPLTGVGTIGNSGQMTWAIPWDKAFASLDIWLQAAWSDSSTKQLALTNGNHVTLPNGLPPSELPAYKTLYDNNPDSTQSRLIRPVTAGYYFPYTMYKTR